MGKATITAESGDGHYTVDLVFDRVKINEAIVLLQSRIFNDQQQVIVKQAELVDLKNNLDQEIIVLDALITQFANDPTPENRELIKGQEKVVIEAKKDYTIKKQEIDALNLRITSNSKRLSKLESLPEKIEQGIWCADYSLCLENDISVIEVPSGDYRLLNVLKPGFLSDNSYDIVIDGVLNQLDVLSPAAVTYNLAMRPGWEKWYPRYRIALVLAVDYINNTCNISIEAPGSSFHDKINTNHLTEYTNVPIEYMCCDSAAIKQGDRVLVEFRNQDIYATEQNWDSNNLVVIGFPQNPRDGARETARRFVDLNFDLTPDYAVFGDVCGRVMRQNVHSDYIAQIDDNGNWLNKNDVYYNGPPTIIFQADKRGFYDAPIILSHPQGVGTLILMAGGMPIAEENPIEATHYVAGELAVNQLVAFPNLGLTNRVNGALYGIWEFEYPQTPIPESQFLQQSFIPGFTHPDGTPVRLITDFPIDWPTHRGWKLEMPGDDEQVIALILRPTLGNLSFVTSEKDPADPLNRRYWIGLCHHADGSRVNELALDRVFMKVHRRDSYLMSDPKFLFG